MDKEAMIQNIKALLAGVVEEGKEVSVTVRSADYADIYLDDEYYNTYHIGEKRLINQAPIQKDERTFEMSATIARNEFSEKYADIAEHIKGAATPDEVNYLARKLAGFSTHEHALYQGAVQQRGLDNCNIIDLINIAYNLQDCQIIYGIQNDAELGSYYADNGHVDWLDGAKKEVWKYLDYQKLGEEMRKGSGGIYTKDGYFINAAKEFQTVYNGETFPESFDEDNYMLKIFVSAGTIRKWLYLPLSEETVQEFTREMEVESLEQCEFLAVQMRLPAE